jgi:hypothetical protein
MVYFKRYKKKPHKNKETKLLKHTKTLIITLLISLKRSRRYESNNIKKGY